MTTPDSEKTGWPRGRWGWLFGTALLIALGILLGLILGSVFLGLFIAAIISIGWLIAYESWRGRNPHLGDSDDNGARL